MRTSRLTLLLAAALLAGGSFALASIPGGDGTIKSCVKKRGGNVRFIDSKKRCKSTERTLVLNQRGPQGQLGATGPQGATGEQGPPGPKGDTGAPGSDAQFNGAAAGGALTGTYPAPSIAPGAVGTSQIGTLPAAYVFNGNSQTITTATNTPVDFPSEHFDTSNLHNTVLNNSRLTAPVAGLYEVSASLNWTGSDTTGNRQVSILKNGATTYVTDRRSADSGGGSAAVTNASALVDMAAGDFVQAIARHTQGADTTLAIGASGSSPAMSMVWVAPAP